ncbi:MAG: hypothetical protein PHS33_08975 [Candidatus Omnitrophica bacterium]|nr:hypothetical protein [Candidatus Omnitrophota bacterium]
MIKLSLKDETPKKKKGTEFTFHPELSGAGEPELLKKRIIELKGAIKALSKDASYFEKEIKNLQSYVDLFENMIGKKKEEGTEKKANQLDTMDFKKKKENENAYYSKAFKDKDFANRMTKKYKPTGKSTPKIALKLKERTFDNLPPDLAKQYIQYKNNAVSQKDLIESVQWLADHRQFFKDKYNFDILADFPEYVQLYESVKDKLKEIKPPDQVK